MNWRVAKSLDTLRNQINTRYPKRNKDSDGTIGNAEHFARESDHNPLPNGVVCAMDITHDPKSGCDSYVLAEILRVGKDPRVKYLISNRKICSGANEDHAAWVWRPDHGANPHDHHIHISVKSDAAHYDDDRKWNLDGAVASVDLPDLDNYQPQPKTLRKGDKGYLVEEMQTLLAKSIAGLRIDGNFGAKTAIALAKFQKTHSLMPDSVCGPQTWGLLKTPK